MDDKRVLLQFRSEGSIWSRVAYLMCRRFDMRWHHCMADIDLLRHNAGLSESRALRAAFLLCARSPVSWEQAIAWA
jgi:hypothetical protein